MGAVCASAPLGASCCQSRSQAPLGPRLAATASNGRALVIVDHVPDIADPVFSEEHTYVFTSFGSFAGRELCYVRPPNSDQQTAADQVMWTIQSPVATTVYLDFWGGQAHTSKAAPWLTQTAEPPDAKALSSSSSSSSRGSWELTAMEGTAWRELPVTAGGKYRTYGPGSVYKQDFPAGEISIYGNGSDRAGTQGPAPAPASWELYRTFFAFLEATDQESGAKLVESPVMVAAQPAVADDRGDRLRQGDGTESSKEARQQEKTRVLQDHQELVLHANEITVSDVCEPNCWATTGKMRDPNLQNGGNIGTGIVDIDGDGCSIKEVTSALCMSMDPPENMHLQQTGGTKDEFREFQEQFQKQVEFENETEQDYLRRLPIAGEVQPLVNRDIGSKKFGTAPPPPGGPPGAAPPPLAAKLAVASSPPPWGAPPGDHFPAAYAATQEAHLLRPSYPPQPQRALYAQQINWQQHPGHPQQCS